MRQVPARPYPMQAQVTTADYPHLNDFTGRLNFRYESRPATQLRISNQAKNIPWVSQVPQLKFDELVYELWSDKQTDKHPDTQT